MKMDKMTQKLLLKQIKTRAAEFGYKVSRGFMFSKIGKNFVSVPHLIVNSTKLGYHVLIKKYSYDDIFWDVMNMADNKKAESGVRTKSWTFQSESGNPGYNRYRYWHRHILPWWICVLATMKLEFY